MPSACLRIGVDCGGTNTDAVVLDQQDRVLGWAKATTTEDVLGGVVAAVQGALGNAGREPGEVAAVMLGTNQFVNAAVQLQGLARVAVVRLCGPATHALPPCCDMPPGLRALVGGCTFLAGGGFEYDGQNKLSPVDVAQLRGIARQIIAAGIRCIVVSGVFSPVNASQEQQAATVLADEAGAALAALQASDSASASGAASSSEAGLQPGNPPASPARKQHTEPASTAGTAGQPAEQLFVCHSHQVGQLGLLERENAAVLNAALLPLAHHVVPACQAALAAAGLSASLWFTGNDGCLLSARDVLQTPVATFQSGPVNSLRGAALLTGIQDGIVVDIGGTTTDVGVLVGGLPRPAPRNAELAGARTNFQMPDVLSIGLGGGSRLRFPPANMNSGGTAAAAAAMQAAHPAEPGASGASGGVDGDGRNTQKVAGPALLATERLRAPALHCIVGPDSVGSQLARDALCFGGQATTATDAAVLLGRMEVAGASPAAVEAAGLRSDQAEAAWQAMQGALERAVDNAKAQAGDVLVVVVGGGAPLCGSTLAGASAVLRPAHASVANAVGAAIAQVGGTVDAVVDTVPTPASRAAALATAQRQATARAVAAGARPGSCWVAALEEVPLAYLPGSVSRVRVKVIGELAIDQLGAGQQGGVAPGQSSLEPAPAQARTASTEATPASLRRPSHGCTNQDQSSGQLPAPSDSQHATEAVTAWPPLPGRGDEPSWAALAAWQPKLSPSGEWLLEEPDLHLIAIGCGILGCGGGGSPDRALLKARMELQRRGAGSMHVISPVRVADDHLVADAGYMGAPTVGIEKLDSDQAEAALLGALEAYRAAESSAPPGSSSASIASGGAADAAAQGTAGSTAAAAGAGLPKAGRRDRCFAAPLAAVMAGEVGGGNGIEPLVVGARLGLPVVDGDLMGRAFPELQMMTSAIYGVPVVPAALADEKGNVVVVQQAAGASWLERLLRPLCTELGCSAGFSARPLTGAQLRQVAVPHSLSLAWRLGQAVAVARAAKQDAAAAVAAAGGGCVLFTGKVVDVQRRTSGGFARGQLRLAGAGAHSGRSMRIDFQNENLVAYLELVVAAGTPAEGEDTPPAAPVGSSEDHAVNAPAGDGAPPQGAAAEVVASVPDLICCIESETGLPIATEAMRYGLRAAVLGLPAHPLLTTPQALHVVGPAAFGHGDVTFAPLAPCPLLAGIPR